MNATWWTDASGRQRINMIAAAVALVTVTVAIWLSWFVWFRTVDREAVVTTKTWERQIELEMFRTVDLSDWEGETPADARPYDSRREVHHYDRVLSHFESYDCGTRDRPQRCSRAVYRDDPVYRWKIYYQADRWVRSKWIVSRGSEIAPFWPELPDTLNTVAVLGNQREGDETRQDYRLAVQCIEDRCDPTVLEVDLATWLSLPTGGRVTASVTATGKVRGIEPIETEEP